MGALQYGKKKATPPEMPEYVWIKDLELDNSEETLAKFKKNNNALIYGPLGTQNITVLNMLVL